MTVQTPPARSKGGGKPAAGPPAEVVRRLRDYQDDAVADVLATDAGVLIEHPTGSGKTLEAAAIAAELLARGKRVVIATTQKHIEAAFVVRPFTALARTDGTILPVPPGTLRPTRDEADGSVRALVAYATGTDPVAHAVVCTHAAVTRAFPPTGLLPKDLGNVVLLLDEGHHAPAAGLGQFVQVWKSRGGRLIYLTATAFRPDGDPVPTDDMVVVRRSLAEHIDPSANGGVAYGPVNVETRLTPVAAAPGVTEEEFRGRVMPRDDATRGRMVAAVVAAWRHDGKPKVVVRVPVLINGSGAVVEPLVAAFRAAGARVLDATGTADADAERFQTALSAERDLARYADSQYDVVVGVNRVVEGMDWPLCSDVYAIGLPRSLLTVVQLLGRSTRLKTQPDYPADARDRARVTFFVPTAPGQDLVDYHRRHTVLVICHLVNPTGAAEWNLIKGLDRGLPVSIIAEAGRAERGTVARSYPRLDPDVRLAATAAIAAARARLLAAGEVASDVRVYAAACAALAPTVTPAVVRQVIVEEEAAQTGEAGERIRSRLVAAIKRAREEEGLGVRDAIRQAFEKVLLDLDQFAVARSDRFAKIDSAALSVTGRSMTELATRLFRERPITVDWLARVVRAHLARRGTLPTARTPGGPPDHPEETWAELDAALRDGRRVHGVTTARSLHEFGQRVGRVRTGRDLLRDFAAAVPPTAAETALLAHLSVVRVRTGKDGRELVAAGELDETALTGARVRSWAAEVCREAGPAVCPHVEVLEYNLLRYTALRAGARPPRARPDPVLDEHAYVEVAVEDRDGWELRVDDARVLALRPGDAFVARAAVEPATAPSLVRADGVRPRTRSDAGYRDATVAVLVTVTAGGRPARSFDGPGADVRVPLSWVTSVETGPEDTRTTARVPRDWIAHVGRLPVPEVD